MIIKSLASIATLYCVIMSIKINYINNETLLNVGTRILDKRISAILVDKVLFMDLYGKIMDLSQRSIIFSKFEK